MFGWIKKKIEVAKARKELEICSFNAKLLADMIDDGSLFSWCSKEITAEDKLGFVSLELRDVANEIDRICAERL